MRSIRTCAACAATDHSFMLEVATSGRCRLAGASPLRTELKVTLGESCSCVAGSFSVRIVGVPSNNLDSVGLWSANDLAKARNSSVPSRPVC